MKGNSLYQSDFYPEESQGDQMRDRLIAFRTDHLKIKHQSKMAEALGIERSLYAHYEKKAKDIPQTVLRRLADEHGLNVHWLVTGRGDPKLVADGGNIVSEKPAVYGEHHPGKVSYDVFLCFADEDEDLAKQLQEVMQALGLSLYAVPVKHHAGGMEQNFGTLRDHMERSRIFVPLFSRHSLQRPLWSFLTGIAASLGKIIIPAIVSGVECNKDDLRRDVFPVQFERFYSLFTMGDFQHFLQALVPDENPAKKQLPQDDKFRKQIQTAVHHSNLRWCYFTGGADVKNDASLTPIFRLAEGLATALLDKGMSLSVKPDAVLGTAVRDAVKKWKDKQPEVQSDSPEARPDFEQVSSLSDSIMPDRIHVKNLTGKEWMITLGESAESREEYKIALSYNAKEKAGIKIFGVPCLGSFGKEVFFHMPVSYRHICDACEYREGLGSNECPHTREIAAFIKDLYL
jgi:hypothetical protein